MEVNYKARIASIARKNTAFLAVLALMLFGVISYGMTFLNYGRNLINVLHTASMIGIMGIGVNLCFLIGARDLSVGAVAAAASMFAAQFSSYGVFAGIGAGMAAGLVFGLINGIVVAKLKVQPFIATLGTQLAARGVALLINSERSIPLDAASSVLIKIGNNNVFGGLMPIPTLIFIILIFGFVVVTKHLPFGRDIYAVGGNEEAAEMMGVRVDKTKILVFVLSGLMAAFSGIVLCGRLSAGQPTACVGWEMTVMAAVVIGGTGVRGGQGGIGGIFFGSLFVNLITNLINLNGSISAYWKDIITGVILLIAVLFQLFSEKGKLKFKQNRKVKGL